MVLSLVPIDPKAAEFLQKPGVAAAVADIESMLLLNDPPLWPASAWNSYSVGACPKEIVGQDVLVAAPTSPGEIKLIVSTNGASVAGGVSCAAKEDDVVHLAHAAVCMHEERPGLPYFLTGYIVVCAEAFKPDKEGYIKNMLFHELLHTLGFQSLPDSLPGSGKAAIEEAKVLLGCEDVSSVPCQTGGRHWHPTLVGTEEVMTPCLTDEVYVSSLTMAAMQDTGRFSLREPIETFRWAWQGGRGCIHNDLSKEGCPSTHKEEDDEVDEGGFAWLKGNPWAWALLACGSVAVAYAVVCMCVWRRRRRNLSQAALVADGMVSETSSVTVNVETGIVDHRYLKPVLKKQASFKGAAHKPTHGKDTSEKASHDSNSKAVTLSAAGEYVPVTFSTEIMRRNHSFHTLDNYHQTHHQLLNPPACTRGQQSQISPPSSRGLDAVMSLLPTYNSPPRQPDTLPPAPTSNRFRPQSDFNA